MHLARAVLPGAACLLLFVPVGFLGQSATSSPTPTPADAFWDPVPERDNPVRDHVPCLLTNVQNYGMRGFKAPKLPSPVVAVAQDVNEKAAQIKPAAGDNMAAAKKMALQSYHDNLLKNFPTATIDFLKKASPALKDDAVKTAVQSFPGLSAEEKKTVQAGAQDSLDQTVDPALNSIQPAFVRPTDISCSMSLLSWQEAHKALGRTIADTYLVVQITVRNLDANNEFLVHDAELAVDANSAQLSRFQVGHEKELTRGVLLYGQAYDRQHVFIHIADGIGTILGSIVGLPQPSNDALTGATGAYNAGWLSFIHLLSPDLTTQNLNTLNDLAFSAAAASRVVVPKSGSVPFLVFIPVRPLEQACWLQKGYDIYLDKYPNSACDQICGEDKNANASQTTAASTNVCTSHKLHKQMFRDWSPVQLQALELHAYAMIAGVHVKELNSQGAVLNAFACAGQTDASGKYLQAPLATLGLNCTLTGSDLDTMTALRFRSPDDPKTTLDAKVTVSGDNAQATASLAPSDAAKIQQSTYELYGVDKSGSEHDLNRSIGFHLLPTITTGQVIPAVGVPNFTLNGSNMNDVAQIVFYDSTNTSEVTRITVTHPTSNAITAPVPTAATLPAGTYAVRVTLSDVPNLVVDTGGKVTR